MKKLLVIVLLPFIGYFGLKTYLHYKVGKSVDKTLDQMRPFVDVTYGGISSTFSGELSLDDVNAKIVGFNDGIKIDSVSIQTPGFFYLMSMGDGKLRSGISEEFPEKFGVAFENARYRVGSDFAMELDRMSKQMMPELDDPRMTCVGQYGFDPIALNRMGYRELVTDMSMHYEQTPRNQIYSFDYDVEKLINRVRRPPDCFLLT